MSLLHLFSTGKSTRSQWDGYYEQDGQKYYFRAELEHTKHRFRGNIIDKEPTYSRLVIEEYMDLSLIPPSEQLAYKRKIAQSLGCAETDTIEVSREQTDRSFVDGDIKNNAVSFVKTYESGVVITIFTDRHKTRHETKPYSILYEGTLSEDGNQITGKWFLHEKAADLLLEGTFAMNRS
ncbi:MAG: hypothetical protein QM758_26115 [Armatimonas sp.]